MAWDLQAESLRGELTENDHHRIALFLKDLSKEQLVSLAPALGLSYAKYRGKEEHLLGDIISGWLKMEDKVARTPCWEVLINALEEIGQNGIAAKIKQSLLSIKKQDPSPSIKGQVSPPPPPPPQGPQIAQNFRPVAPVINGASSLEAKFPYLNTEQLSQGEKNMLIGRLEVESKKIRRKFADLVITTTKSLEARTVTTEKIVLLLENYDINPSSEYTTIDGVLIIASKYWSFFNYGILEALIDHFGDGTDRERLAGYKSDFKEYCKRRLCEVPIDALKSDRNITTRLYVKTDKNFNVPIDDIYSLATELSDLLGTTLFLLNVKDGCVELDFDYSKEENLLPLKDGHSNLFKKLNITKLYTDGRIFYEKKSDQNRKVEKQWKSEGSNHSAISQIATPSSAVTHKKTTPTQSWFTNSPEYIMDMKNTTGLVEETLRTQSSYSSGIGSIGSAGSTGSPVPGAWAGSERHLGALNVPTADNRPKFLPSPIDESKVHSWLAVQEPPHAQTSQHESNDFGTCQQAASMIVDSKNFYKESSRTRHQITPTEFMFTHSKVSAKGSVPGITGPVKEEDTPSETMPTRGSHNTLPKRSSRGPGMQHKSNYRKVSSCGELQTVPGSSAVYHLSLQRQRRHLHQSRRTLEEASTALKEGDRRKEIHAHQPRPSHHDQQIRTPQEPPPIDQQNKMERILRSEVARLEVVEEKAKQLGGELTQSKEEKKYYEDLCLTLTERLSLVEAGVGATERNTEEVVKSLLETVASLEAKLKEKDEEIKRNIMRGVVATTDSGGPMSLPSLSSELYSTPLGVTVLEGQQQARDAQTSQLPVVTGSGLGSGEDGSGVSVAKLLEEIRGKDETIQKLTQQLGKLEAGKSVAISLVEHKTAMDQLKEENATLQRERELLSAQLGGEQQMASSSAAKLEETKKEVALLQEQLDEEQRESEKLKRTVKVWSSKCKQLTEEKEQLKQQCVLLQGIVENKEQLEQKDDQLAKMEEKLKLQKKEIKDRDCEQRHQETQEQLTQQKHEQKLEAAVNPEDNSVKTTEPDDKVYTIESDFVIAVL